MIKNTVIDKLINNLKKLDVGAISSKTVSSARINDAVDLNLEQLSTGTLNNNETVGNYSKATEGYNTYRSTKVSSSERIKFYDTGQFYRSIKGQITNKGELKITSRSRKLPKLNSYLEDKGFTGSLLGLTPQNIKKWLSFYKQDLINNIQKELIK